MQENKLLTNSTDPHLFFTFNNIYSKNWNLFIENTNKGGGTKIVAFPDKTVSFATPDYQNNTYYLGTTKKQKTFKHTLAANMLDKSDVQAILQWLKVGQTGFLYYDTNRYWGWDVVVTDVGEVSEYEDSTGIIIEFSVEFKTINDWHSRSVYSAWKKLGSGGFETTDSSNGSSIVVSQSIANEYGIPEICQKGTKIYLPQVCDEHSFIQLNWVAKDGKTTTITHDNNVLLKYSFNLDSLNNLDNLGELNCNYDSRYGFTLLNSDLLENSVILKENSDTISSIFNLDNILPTTDPTKYQNFSNRYKCEIYARTENNLLDSSGFSNDSFPLTYEVILYLYIDGKLHAMGSSDWGTSEEPIVTYYGLYNELSLTDTDQETKATACPDGTLTIIKHSSL